MTYFPTEDRDGTVIITLTNGERNTLNLDLLEQGAAALQMLAKNPPEGGVVLTGAGEHFTCGMDTKVAASLDEAGQKRAVASINAFAAALHRLPCAVVCAVNGNAETSSTAAANVDFRFIIVLLQVLRPIWPQRS